MCVDFFFFLKIIAFNLQQNNFSVINNTVTPSRVYILLFYWLRAATMCGKRTQFFFPAHSFRERSSAVSRIPSRRRVIIRQKGGKTRRGGVLCKRLRYTTHRVRGLTRECNNNIWVDRRRIPVIGANAVTTRHRY